VLFSVVPDPHVEACRRVRTQFPQAVNTMFQNVCGARCSLAANQESIASYFFRLIAKRKKVFVGAPYQLIGFIF
jgi:hypothetical protein